jgi:hypothetical protein
MGAVLCVKCSKGKLEWQNPEKEFDFENSLVCNRCEYVYEEGFLTLHEIIDKTKRVIP